MRKRHSKFTGIVTVENCKMWYVDGKLHREDGPAFEAGNGSKEWYIDDLRHRTDGPAVVYFKGGLYKKGSLKWCYYDREYSFKAWCEITEKTEDEIIQLKLKWF